MQSSYNACHFWIPECAPACQAFVDENGLKVLFAAFMGKVSSLNNRFQRAARLDMNVISVMIQGKKGKKYQEDIDSIEEHQLSVIAQV